MELVPKPLLDGVLRVFDPVQVILFGSRARGDARPDSDIDLYVVVDDDTPEENRSYKARARAAMDYAGGVDIVIATRSTDARRRELLGALARTVHLEGRLVYARE